MNKPDRTLLGFREKARKAFAFLKQIGFSEVEASPTYLLYRKGDVEVDVYHGRQSYEIGGGITAFGTRYSISEIIGAENLEFSKQFRYQVATSEKTVERGLDELNSIIIQYGKLALKGDVDFFTQLGKQKQIWSEEYALDVLAEQLRPQAEEAFRRKNYVAAVELYSQIRARLSSSEKTKLKIAEERMEL